MHEFPIPNKSEITSLAEQRGYSDPQKKYLDGLFNKLTDLLQGRKLQEVWDEYEKDQSDENKRKVEQVRAVILRLIKILKENDFSGLEWKMKIELSEKDVVAEFQATELDENNNEVAKEVYSVGFSPDNKKVALGSKNGKLQIINIKELKKQGKEYELLEFDAGNCVNSVSFNKEGTQVAIGECYSKLQIIDIEELEKQGKAFKPLEFDAGNWGVNSVSFNKEGTQVAVQLTFKGNTFMS